MSNNAGKTCLNCGCALLTPNYPADGACAACPIDNAAKEGPCCGFADIDMSNFGTVDAATSGCPARTAPSSKAQALVSLRIPWKTSLATCTP